MISLIKRYWPLVISIGILWIAIATCGVLSIRQNQANFVYGIDDPYIHMAIAKNIVNHGVWGLTRYEFTSLSSSLLWTLLLSLVYFLFGINEVSPFVLNVVSGTFLCVFGYIILRKRKLPNFFIFIVLAAIIFFTPLVPLIFFGMEHTLHTLLTVIFVYLSANILTQKKINPPESLLLIGLAPLVIATRYEGMFLVFVVSLLFIVRKKPLYALLLSTIGILPRAIYGLFSVSNGWYFLPNSVLLKGNTPDISSVKGIINFIYQPVHIILKDHPRILILIMGALVVFYARYITQKKIWKNSIIMLIVFMATTFLQIQFTSASWFFRHGAYLIALGIFVLSIALYECLPDEYSLEKLKIKWDNMAISRYIVLAFPIVVFALPVAKKGFDYLRMVPQATTNVYEQQYQMGLFLKKFYRGQAVAANDVGAINYLADIKCLDLFGIGDIAVTRALSEGRYNRKKIYDLTKSKRVRIAVVYARYFRLYRLPKQWVQVGQWRILNNVVCGDDTVSFYAVDPSETDNLINNLKAFSHCLPQNVIQSGKYVKQLINDGKKRSPSAQIEPKRKVISQDECRGFNTKRYYSEILFL